MEIKLAKTAGFWYRPIIASRRNR